MRLSAVSSGTTLPIALLLLLAAAPSRAQGQEAGSPESVSGEDEEAGRSREGRAWGEAPPEDAGGALRSAYHRYGHVFTSLGAGGTVRLLAYADVCDPEAPNREGCRFSPPYLQIRGGWLFEGDGELQHGAGLGIATNLSADGEVSVGIDPFAQWTLSPSYFLRYWFDPWIQLMGHVGVPLVISNVTGTSGEGGTEFNWGLEAQVGVVFKFVTGFGLYAAANVAAYFAGDVMTWPTLSGELGAVFEYEVLP